ncbi:MAG: glutamine--fructose-6-phosphate transaminase (isomerizing) [Clostridia bacterium]|nr:glutamine--fructose-6-phosphate transaminase (isomerizing) [Clostridia bacterium]
MCGIIGYAGNENAVPKILKGLSLLEYRGYDSAGVAFTKDNAIRVIKAQGRVDNLSEKIAKNERSYCSIGHTRWATHGEVNDINAHPHKVGRVCLVHNGIIENYKDIKSDLETQGVTFLSETDTEVACALIDKYYTETEDEREAIEHALSELKGSYAFAIMFEGREGVWVTKQESSLVVGFGNDGFYISSDIVALLPFTDTYCHVNDHEIGHLTADGVKIFCGSEEKQIEWKKSTQGEQAIKKDGYAHFMLKEMHEQSSAIYNTVSPRIKNTLPDFSSDIDENIFENIDRIELVACGSAMHASLVGAHFIENLAKIPSSVYIASEYRYSPPLFRKNTLTVAVSQSGETADTLGALRVAKNIGNKTLAIVNAKETSIAKEADSCIYTQAGPEIAVATTKGYATQVALMYLIAVYLANKKAQINAHIAQLLVKNISEKVPAAITETLNREDEIKTVARRIFDNENLFYIGRGIDYYTSMEAALKLKEISYIHAQAYPSAELKHGTISLIEKNTPVIAISTLDELYSKTESNLLETSSRGAYTVLISSDKGAHSADINISIPYESDVERFYSTLIITQMIAYYTAFFRGCDIDRPRNLAKSVTVE